MVGLLQVAQPGRVDTYRPAGRGGGGRCRGGDDRDQDRRDEGPWDGRLLRRRVDLDDLVYAERDRVAVEHPDLKVDGGVTPTRATGDPDQLHRALRNLVDNAARHARSTVTISLAARAGEAEVVVGNDGPAIAAEDRARIFDRFVRLDGSRSRLDGAALRIRLPITEYQP